MTPQELREAAERVRRMNAGEQSKIVYGWGDGKLDDDDCRTLELKRIEDYKKLADAYLAKHPADDGELVTPQWLVSQGWTHKKHGGYDDYEYNHWLHMRWYASGVVMLYFNNKDISGDMTTCGYIRHLLAALKGE